MDLFFLWFGKIKNLCSQKIMKTHAKDSIDYAINYWIDDYKKDYINWGSPPRNDPIRPTSALTIFGGGNFVSSTMYKTDFK